MATKKVLWVDDDMWLWTGLSRLLGEMEDINLVEATNLEVATGFLHNKDVDLLIFDLVMMEDDHLVTLERRGGMRLAKIALDHDVRRFIAYTILAEEEVKQVLTSFVSSADLAEGLIKYDRFRKCGTSIKVVAERVRGLLGL